MAEEIADPIQISLAKYNLEECLKVLTSLFKGFREMKNYVDEHQSLPVDAFTRFITNKEDEERIATFIVLLYSGLSPEIGRAVLFKLKELTGPVMDEKNLV
jgi:hypothetical protein